MRAFDNFHVYHVGHENERQYNRWISGCISGSLSQGYPIIMSWPIIRPFQVTQPHKCDFVCGLEVRMRTLLPYLAAQHALRDSYVAQLII